MQETTPASIALFDFSHAVSVAFHGVGPEGTTDTVIAQLSALRSSCERVILCLDSKPYRRNQVFDGYKAGRKQDPELSNIWDRTLDRVMAEGYSAARAPGEEADDCMATLARIYSVEYGCGDVRLVTADKDIAQCLTDDNTVRWFVPQLGQRDQFEIRTAQWVQAHFGGVDWGAEKKVGPTPAEVPLVQAICGDTSDKIPGVKGIGIKGAVGLVKTFGTPEGMAQGLIAEQNNCKLKGKDMPAFWRNFSAGMASIPQWLALTTLRTDVELEQHPLKYLERVEPKQLVQEDELPASELEDDPRGDAWEPSADELEAERAAMAAELPVGPAPQRPFCDHKFIDSNTCGKCGVHVNVLRAEPMEDGPVRRERQAAESDKHMPMPAMLIGKDPKADGVLRELAEQQTRASSGTASTTPPQSAPPAPAQTTSQSTEPAPSGGGAASPPPAATQPAPAPSSSSRAQVVSPNQGPRKGDEIPQPSDLVRVAPPSWALAAQPATANEMLAIAKVLFNSRFYSQFGSERGVFAAMALGRELGMGMSESLEAFHIVQDRPFPKAVWILARGQRHPDCEWLMVTSADAKHAVLSTQHRKAGRLDYEYTIERAALAGYLTGKNRHNWETKPQEMLEARAISKGVRRWYPGATFGMHSFEEEQDRGE
jgi:5'-3' exonuclease